MSSTLNTISGISEDLATIFDSIRELREAGHDKKTQQLETDALKALAKVAEIVEANAKTTRPKTPQIDYYKARIKELDAIIKDSDNSVHVRLLAIDERGTKKIQLAGATLGALPQLASILTPEEVKTYKEIIEGAHEALVRRIRLDAWVEAVLDVSAAAASIATKILIA